MAGTRERFRMPEAVARDVMRQQHESKLTRQMLHEMNGLLGCDMMRAAALRRQASSDLAGNVYAPQNDADLDVSS